MAEKDGSGSATLAAAPRTFRDVDVLTVLNGLKILENAAANSKTILAQIAGTDAPAILNGINAIGNTVGASAANLTRLLGTDFPTALNQLNAIENGLLGASMSLTRLTNHDAPVIHNALNGVANIVAGTSSQLQQLVNIDIPAMRNALNGLENNVLVLRLLAEQAAASDRRRDQVDALHRRAVAARVRPAADVAGIQAARPHALAETLRDLERRAPANFETWLRLLEESKVHYRRRSAADLSVAWHREAQLFGEFLEVHAAGRVLDIGVGPLPVPSYLDAISLDRLAGLDPIEPFEPHPFVFANSVAEAIPWPDASFETVVAATSLDHAYLLDVALDEVTRVLAPGGVFLVWTGLLPESPAYDPYGDAVRPIDDYHLFHPGENWFPALMTKRLRMRERIEVASNTVFMAFEKT